MYRSFPSVRMTTLRFVVILTEGKDLYVMVMNHILNKRLIYGLMTLGMNQNKSRRDLHSHF